MTIQLTEANIKPVTAGLSHLNRNKMVLNTPMLVKTFLFIPGDADTGHGEKTLNWAEYLVPPVRPFLPACKVRKSWKLFFHGQLA